MNTLWVFTLIALANLKIYYIGKLLQQASCPMRSSLGAPIDRSTKLFVPSIPHGHVRDYTPDRPRDRSALDDSSKNSRRYELGILLGTLFI